MVTAERQALRSKEKIPDAYFIDEPDIFPEREITESLTRLRLWWCFPHPGRHVVQPGHKAVDPLQSKQSGRGTKELTTLVLSLLPSIICFPLILSHRLVVQPQNPRKPGVVCHCATAVSVVRICLGGAGSDGNTTERDDDASIERAEPAEVWGYCCISISGQGVDRTMIARRRCDKRCHHQQKRLSHGVPRDLRNC